ncbi:hypothetical protein HYW46_03250 [Candidatus Daviesbacteria bacterium]|nr:hypothetical protein [Candidatus Daviesbacteria bacterium]
MIEKEKFSTSQTLSLPSIRKTPLTNEDSLVVSGNIAVLTDGMGGSRNTRMASRYVSGMILVKHEKYV